jgi:hypothetical protein
MYISKKATSISETPSGDYLAHPRWGVNNIDYSGISGEVYPRNIANFYYFTHQVVVTVN